MQNASLIIALTAVQHAPEGEGDSVDVFASIYIFDV